MALTVITGLRSSFFKNKKKCTINIPEVVIKMKCVSTYKAEEDDELN